MPECMIPTLLEERERAEEAMVRAEENVCQADG